MGQLVGGLARATIAVAAAATAVMAATMALIGISPLLQRIPRIRYAEFVLRATVCGFRRGRLDGVA